MASSHPPLTAGAHSYIQPLASLVASAFSNDPLVRSIILYQDRIFETTEAVIPYERWLKFWIENITPKTEKGGVIVETGNWAAGALWFPPGQKKPPLGTPEQLSVVQKEYVEKFEAIKERHLKGRPHWYLNIIGRHPERREPGAIRAIIDAYLAKAREDGVPVFLEASNAHARDVYAHLGFRVAEEVLIGKGHVDARGNLIEGGDGIVLWGMIVEPVDGVME